MIMVAKVRAALNTRFPNGDAPKILFTDRGPGFYNSGNGHITAGYKQALRDHSLRWKVAAFRSDRQQQLLSSLLSARIERATPRQDTTTWE